MGKGEGYIGSKSDHFFSLIIKFSKVDFAWSSEEAALRIASKTSPDLPPSVVPLPLSITSNIILPFSLVSLDLTFVALALID